MYRRGAMVIHNNSVSTLTVDYGENMSIQTQLYKETFVREPDVPSWNHGNIQD